MREQIVDERNRTKTYISLCDYLTDYPDKYIFYTLEDEKNFKHVEKIPLKEGEYTWGDYTEIKIWDSPEEFARKHSERHPMPQVQEALDSRLAMEIYPRFKRKCLINIFGLSMVPISQKGHMFEILGLRDGNGDDIDSVRTRQKYPSHVYCAPDELQKRWDAQTAETTRFLKAFEARQERTKNLSLQLD